MARWLAVKLYKNMCENCNRSLLTSSPLSCLRLSSGKNATVTKVTYAQRILQAAYARVYTSTPLCEALLQLVWPSELPTDFKTPVYYDSQLFLSARVNICRTSHEYRETPSPHKLVSRQSVPSSAFFSLPLLSPRLAASGNVFASTMPCLLMTLTMTSSDPLKLTAKTHRSIMQRLSIPSRRYMAQA